MKVKRNEIFTKVQGLRPGRSIFDLSYAKKMSGKMGYLYPMMCDEVVPGDIFKIGAEAVIRFAPMVAPILHEIMLRADWFFVPYRLLYTTQVYGTEGKNAWEQFITGGRNNTVALTRAGLGLVPMHSNVVQEGGFWDHIGIPPGVTLDSDVGDDNPLAFPGIAYNVIYNNYYRDPNLEDEIDPNAAGNIAANKVCASANWDADYFTRALPFQQRGTPPAIPLSGMTQAVWPTADFNEGATYTAPTWTNGGVDKRAWMAAGQVQANDNFESFMNDNTVSLAPGTSININDLRNLIQLQRWLERNARGGYRYTEWLRANFGESPTDERLDRPEYIGGIRQPIVISEVLQTSKSEAGAPQGNLAGHGIAAGYHNVGKYHVNEYGLIMCIMSIVPRTAYQQGINRQWLRQTKYDFYHPAFANLSEQAIKNEEIYLSAGHGTNTTIWGYQGRYDEMRTKHDIICGAMRSSLNYWHVGRIFGSLPALSSSFGHVDASSIHRIFAVPETDNLYIHWGNKIKAIRPLPPMSNPGRMDHEYGGY